MSVYRPQFEQALRLFGRASEAMKARGLSAPVLVGGAAVEIYTSSALNTGDFDIVTPWQQEFEEELRRLGFIRPSGRGRATRGWIHPDLQLGFEVVARSLLGGLAERERVRLIDLGEDGVAAVISVEDMIADRMGQYASGAAPEMLEQARRLFALHADVDRDYMEKRIRHESAGEYGVADLEG
ncbi:MAG: hypothetical protein ACK4K7_00585 [Allosphingosinicella sp.]|uniref:hypothetical protein n=1 Tax=Allosphingosinicella sp. TaxID=2823234 RepID=UPI0039348C5C